jgi:transcriptional regulator with XRE-family HTH domain
MDNNIKHLRLERGLTQEVLADRIGTNAGQIHKLESGMRRLSDVWISKLVKGLHCTPADLFGDGGQRNIPIIGEVPGGDLIAAIDAPPDGFVQFSSTRQNLRALRVRGNSMSRLAPDGMYVVVDFDDNDPARLNNQPVIVCIESPATGDHECSFKIYKRNPDRFEPYSIEPGYDAIFPHDRQWKIYGRAIGFIGYAGKIDEEVRLIARIP